MSILRGIIRLLGFGKNRETNLSSTVFKREHRFDLDEKNVANIGNDFDIDIETEDKDRISVENEEGKFDIKDISGSNTRRTPDESLFQIDEDEVRDTEYDENPENNKSEPDDKDRINVKDNIDDIDKYFD
ncbi:hypothetical protein ACFLR5_00520 [Elusimicrobiota bacterium]